MFRSGYAVLAALFPFLAYAADLSQSDAESVLRAELQKPHSVAGCGFLVVEKSKLNSLRVEGLTPAGSGTVQANLTVTDMLGRSLKRDCTFSFTFARDEKQDRWNLRLLSFKGMKAVKGPVTYKHATLEWIQNRTRIIEWCKARPDDGNCQAALPMLREKVEPGNSPADCLPTFVVDGDRGTFTTWNCNGGVTARLRRQGQGWTVESVEAPEESGD